jgi:ATP-dependent DNA helicase 2 subunit 1
VFESRELGAVRAPRGAGLVILGFKPRALCLKPHHVAGVSRFVYPDERRMRGSTAAFVALHKAMLDQVRLRLS